VQLVDLISVFRDEADDGRTPYLWSDYILTTWANEAQIEAFRRARLGKDSSTSAICSYSLAQNAQFITLDPRIIFVKQLNLASKPTAIQRAFAADLDRELPGWNAGSTAGGDIIAWCPDYTVGQIWFSSPSPAADTVNIRVLREPLSAMRQQVITTTGTTTNTTTAIDPELNPRYQIKLVEWMKYRAFSKQDSETNDPKKAAAALAAFEAEFGKAQSAQNEMYSMEQYGYDDYDGVY
jgi:hypothetical protein